MKENKSFKNISKVVFNFAGKIEILYLVLNRVFKWEFIVIFFHSQKFSFDILLYMKYYAIKPVYNVNLS